MNKDAIRKQMIKSLNKLDSTEYLLLSKAIKKQLFSTKEFINAKTIGITLSKYPEVDTRPIIEAAWELGKIVAVPKCISTTKKMDFRAIHNFETLETVYYGLEEPIVSDTEAVSNNQIDLQIVPGVIFSTNGYRIGFGGGYYDRYLETYSNAIVSLAFERQIIDVIPIEEHDIPVEKIITENRVISCQKGEITK